MSARARPAGGAVLWTVLDTLAAIRDRAADRLLGPRCPRCWLRVFPRDLPAHNLDCDDL